jgi:septum formation protein
VELILASASPRRAEILRTLGIPFRVEASDADESLLPGECASDHAVRLARAKAETVRARHPAALILAGDTIVTLDGTVLGKPADAAEAVGMLLQLQGKTHEVVSALALAMPEGAGRAARTLSRIQVTAVTIRPLGPALAEAYAATGEPFDKAGGYGIQGKGAALVEAISGDYSGVVGLPVPLLLRLLGEAGFPYEFRPDGG